MNKMMLSIFKGYADTMPVAVSLDEVVRLIREDKVLADHTHGIVGRTDAVVCHSEEH